MPLRYISNPKYPCPKDAVEIAGYLASNPYYEISDRSNTGHCTIDVQLADGTCIRCKIQGENALPSSQHMRLGDCFRIRGKFVENGRILRVFYFEDLADNKPINQKQNSRLAVVQKMRGA